MKNQTNRSNWMRAGRLVAVLLGAVLLASAGRWGRATVYRLGAADSGTVAPIDVNAPMNNAALFIGINQFPKDSSVATLRYAVDDAISQAHSLSWS